MSENTNTGRGKPHSERGEKSGRRGRPGDVTELPDDRPRWTPEQRAIRAEKRKKARVAEVGVIMDESAHHLHMMAQEDGVDLALIQQALSLQEQMKHCAIAAAECADYTAEDDEEEAAAC